MKIVEGGFRFHVFYEQHPDVSKQKKNINYFYQCTTNVKEIQNFE